MNNKGIGNFCKKDKEKDWGNEQKSQTKKTRRWRVQSIIMIIVEYNNIIGTNRRKSKIQSSSEIQQSWKYFTGEKPKNKGVNFWESTRKRSSSEKN